jgi:hypothetical protein
MHQDESHISRLQPSSLDNDAKALQIIAKLVNAVMRGVPPRQLRPGIKRLYKELKGSSTVSGDLEAKKSSRQRSTR